jgi:hypothetical protein
VRSENCVMRRSRRPRLDVVPGAPGPEVRSGRHAG